MIARTLRLRQATDTSHSHHDTILPHQKLRCLWSMVSDVLQALEYNAHCTTNLKMRLLVQQIFKSIENCLEYGLHCTPSVGVRFLMYYKSENASSIPRESSNQSEIVWSTVSIVLQRLVPSDMVERCGNSIVNQLGVQKINLEYARYCTPKHLI